MSDFVCLSLNCGLPLCNVRSHALRPRNGTGKLDQQLRCQRAPRRSLTHRVRHIEPLDGVLSFGLAVQVRCRFAYCRVASFMRDASSKGKRL